jgi:hypothetical protein
VHRVLAELLLNDSLLDIATRSAVYFQLIEVVDAASRVDCNMLFRFATRSVADHSPIMTERWWPAASPLSAHPYERVEALGPPAAQVYSALLWPQRHCCNASCARGKVKCCNGPPRVATCWAACCTRHGAEV